MTRPSSSAYARYSLWRLALRFSMAAWNLTADLKGGDRARWAVAMERSREGSSWGSKRHEDSRALLRDTRDIVQEELLVRIKIKDNVWTIKGCC